MHAVPVCKTFKSQNIRKGYIGEVLKKKALSWDFPILMVTNNGGRVAGRTDDGLTLPERRNLAPSPAARSTPRGLQLNL